MTDDVTRSGLRVPAPRAVRSDAFDIRPKRLEAWLEDLPLGDSEVSARRIFEALGTLNRMELPVGERLRVLETVYESFHYSLHGLQKQCYGKSLPLSDKSLRHVDRIQLMLGEMANGYKLAAVDILERDRFFDKKHLPLALYRALEHHALTLLCHYQIYAPEPPLLWLEINRLYQVACKRKLHQQAVKAIRNQALGTIENRYKQVLLMALSNPYHLRVHEIETLFQEAPEWIEDLGLHPAGDPDTAPGEFVCCLYRDQPPVSLALYKLQDSEDCLFLDLGPMIETLRSRIALVQPQVGLDNADHKAQDPEQRLHLLKRLLSSWEAKSKRTFSRSNHHGTLDISIGLNSTHHLIDETQAQVMGGTQDTAEPAAPDQPEQTSPPAFSLEPIPGETRGENYWNTRTEMRDYHVTTLSGGVENNSLPEPSYSSSKWKTVNVSAGGYCLLWDHDNSSNAQVGEVIGLRETGNGVEHNWSIGVVRWMQYIRGQGLKLGIQILAPKADPVVARLMNGRASKKRDYRCLNLPEIKAMQQPASLLAPSLHYKVGDALILNDHGQLVNVQLTRLVESTGNFTRFQYTPVNRRETQNLQKEIDRVSGEWKKLW